MTNAPGFLKHVDGIDRNRTTIMGIPDDHYRRRDDMAMAFTASLNEEATELAALGVGLIQFHEPAFNAQKLKALGAGAKLAAG